jgi:hypothetical protein
MSACTGRRRYPMRQLTGAHGILMGGLRRYRELAFGIFAIDALVVAVLRKPAPRVNQAARRAKGDRWRPTRSRPATVGQAGRSDWVSTFGWGARRGAYLL